MNLENIFVVDEKFFQYISSFGMVEVNSAKDNRKGIRRFTSPNGKRKIKIFHDYCMELIGQSNNSLYGGSYVDKKRLERFLSKGVNHD